MAPTERLPARDLHRARLGQVVGAGRAARVAVVAGVPAVQRHRFLGVGGQRLVQRGAVNALDENARNGDVDVHVPVGSADTICCRRGHVHDARARVVVDNGGDGAGDLGVGHFGGEVARAALDERNLAGHAAVCEGAAGLAVGAGQRVAAHAAIERLGDDHVVAGPIGIVGPCGAE